MQVQSAADAASAALCAYCKVDNTAAFAALAKKGELTYEDHPEGAYLVLLAAVVNRRDKLVRQLLARSAPLGLAIPPIALTNNRKLYAAAITNADGKRPNAVLFELANAAQDHCLRKKRAVLDLLLRYTKREEDLEMLCLAWSMSLADARAAARMSGNDATAAGRKWLALNEKRWARAAAKGESRWK